MSSLPIEHRNHQQGLIVTLKWNPLYRREKWSTEYLVWTVLWEKEGGCFATEEHLLLSYRQDRLFPLNTLYFHRAEGLFTSLPVCPGLEQKSHRHGQDPAFVIHGEVLPSLCPDASAVIKFLPRQGWDPDKKLQVHLSQTYCLETSPLLRNNQLSFQQLKKAVKYTRPGSSTLRIYKEQRGSQSVSKVTQEALLDRISIHLSTSL